MWSGVINYTASASICEHFSKWYLSDLEHNGSIFLYLFVIIALPLIVLNIYVLCACIHFYSISVKGSVRICENSPIDYWL